MLRKIIYRNERRSEIKKRQNINKKVKKVKRKKITQGSKPLISDV